ncbi:MAG: mechanosensitive ion channel [Desertifilum sp.]|nr:mechanosensitive ion channel [Desertifilum sp.]
MNNLIETVVQRIANLFNTEILALGETSVTLNLIFQILLALFLILFICRNLKGFLKYRILSKFKIDEGNREAIATIISYGIGTLSILVLLQTQGFNLASLAVLAGGLGVGIGLGLQSLTKNFTSGLTLLLERKLKVGDFIEFAGLSGYIKEISLRATVIRTREGGDVVVPNSQLVENQVLNWSYDTFTARVQIPVGVAYGTDPVLVTETLLNCAYADASVLHDPAPRVIFKGFGDNALNFELWVWVNRIDLSPIIRSSINFIIEYQLRQQGISIPFPQRDLWLRNPEVLTPTYSTNNHHPVSSLPELEKPKKPLSLRQLLHEVVYFQNLNDLELRQMIEIGYRKRLSSSQVLFREGDPGDAFYIILSGEVEVYVEKIGKHLTTLGPGKFFGELSLMLGIPRTATIRATEETLLFAINNLAFEKLLREHPELTEAIIQELARHREELAERQKQLREMGLVDDDEDDKNPVIWVRKRLKNLFGVTSL